MSENELVTTQQISSVPAFLKSAENVPMGTEQLSEYMIPSFLRIVQGLSAREIKEQFDEGDVILQPDKIGIYSKDHPDPVPFTPLLFYTEYCVWNPLKTKGQLPFIRERSTDPNSEIAQKARNPDQRNEPCPEMPSENLRYVEHLNFLVQLRVPNAPVLPVIMSFVVGEHMTGRKFANLICSRNQPLYACVFQFTTSLRSNKQGNSWFGFDIVNHPTNPWVTEEEFNLLKLQHIGLIQKLRGGNLKADYEGGFGDVDPAAAGAEHATGGTGATVDSGIPTDGPIIDQAPKDGSPAI